MISQRVVLGRRHDIALPMMARLVISRTAAMNLELVHMLRLMGILETSTHLAMELTHVVLLQVKVAI